VAVKRDVDQRESW